MVMIIGYIERQKESGESFNVLELQGGVEMVVSKETGNFYATAKRAFVPSTFDSNTCTALIGTEIPGQIVKESCKPYDYFIKETGEEITLSHKWVYVPESQKSNKQLEPEISESSIADFI